MLRYTDVSGGFLLKKMKRISQLKFSYVFIFLLRKMNIEYTLKAELFTGEEIILPANDIDVGNLYFFGCISPKELPLIKWMIKNVNTDEVFYDIGANYGFYTHVAKQIAQNGHVHVFEPNPRLFGYLTKNLESDKNMTLNNIALSDHDGEIDFYIGATNTASGVGTIRSEVADTWKYDPLRQKVRCSKMDSYSTNKNTPTLIKLDVEGAEKSVIDGMKVLLMTHSPVIAMEVWGGARGDSYSLAAAELLLNSGYEVHKISEEGEISTVELSSITNHGSSFANYIFKRHA